MTMLHIVLHRHEFRRISIACYGCGLFYKRPVKVTCRTHIRGTLKTCSPFLFPLFHLRLLAYFSTPKWTPYNLTHGKSLFLHDLAALHEFRLRQRRIESLRLTSSNSDRRRHTGGSLRPLGSALKLLLSFALRSTPPPLTGLGLLFILLKRSNRVLPIVRRRIRAHFPMGERRGNAFWNGGLRI